MPVLLLDVANQMPMASGPKESQKFVFGRDVHTSV